MARDASDTMAFEEFMSNLPRDLKRFARRLADGLNLSQAARELRWTPYRKNQATADLAAALTAAGFAGDRTRRRGKGAEKRKRWVLPEGTRRSHVLANNTRLLGGTRQALCWHSFAVDAI